MSDASQAYPVAAEAAEVGAGATPVRLESVGLRLRTAREAARLTVTEVAQSLKFSPRQIESLEADDFDALPGNTIVRGFVRSYGRLLKLDIDDLLRLLDALSPNAPADVRPPDNMGVASQPGGGRQISPILSVAIILALAALLLALWHFFGPNPGRSATVAVNQGQQAQHAATLGPAAPETPAVSSPQADGVPPTPPPGGNVVLPGAPAATGPSSAGANLLFVFQERSWLEVTDAAKQKLYSGENQAGGRLSLSGTPPFDIVVGNAGRVSLTYGERVIDLAPYTRADVARLILE